MISYDDMFAGIHRFALEQMQLSLLIHTLHKVESAFDTFQKSPS